MLSAQRVAGLGPRGRAAHARLRREGPFAKLIEGAVKLEPLARDVQPSTRRVTLQLQALDLHPLKKQSKVAAGRAITQNSRRKRQ